MRSAFRVVVLCVILIFANAAFAFAVLDPLPISREIRLRAVSFADTSQGWAVGDGILHTDNGGISWYRQFASKEVLDAVDFVSPTHGWAVGYYGVVMRTIDGGATWVQRRTGHSFGLTDVDFVDSDYGWAVGYDDVVLRTTDGGLTWTAASIPLVAGWPQTLKAVSFVSRTHGWVCGPSGTMGDGFNDLYIAKTTNGGATWVRCSPGSYKPGGSDDLWDYTDIDFVSATTGWVTGWMPGMHKTTTSASSWSAQSAFGVEKLDFFDTMRGVGVGGGGALYTMDGGASWNHPDTPPLVGYGSGVCMASATEAWAVAQSLHADAENPEGMISHTINGGADWHSEHSSAGPVHFLGGSTRYHTAANLARLTNAASTIVVLATGRNYPDALSAAGLAGALDGVLLLTDTTLPAVIEDTIAALGTTHVVIVGGPGAVSSAIEARLQADYAVERIHGADRFETAANVARRIANAVGSAPEVMVVNGGSFADAASAAAVAYTRNMPILLVRTDSLPVATAAVIGEMSVSEISVVGGPVAVDDATLNALSDCIPGTATRVAAGANRYDTSAKLAQWAIGRGWLGMSNIGIATGRSFPDALAGGVMAGSYAGPMLLTDPLKLSPETQAQVGAASVGSVWIMNDRGGGAVSDAVATRLAYLLAH